MLKINFWFWFSLLRELKRRGKGRTESGAFLLGEKGSNRISSYILYDDVDPNCLDSGIIQLSHTGQIKASKICISKGLAILADVHTHPSDWTGQSEADRENPIVNKKGHVAFIVPNYARNPFLLMKGVGAYEYQGRHLWKNYHSLRLTLL